MQDLCAFPPLALTSVTLDYASFTIGMYTPTDTRALRFRCEIPLMFNTNIMSRETSDFFFLYRFLSFLFFLLCYVLCSLMGVEKRQNRVSKIVWPGLLAVSRVFPLFASG